MIIELKTERLLLRQWRDSDLIDLLEMCSDSLVMKYFPSILTKKETENMMSKFKEDISKDGWGVWCLELQSNFKFLGFIGLRYKEFDVSIPNTPFLEILWRLSSKHWGKGYATESAIACLDFSFKYLKENFVYAYTATQNKNSIKLMERLGMVNLIQDFSHPSLEKDHSLSNHCLYRISKDILDK